MTPLQQARSRSISALRPPPALSVSQWAEQYAFIPRRGNAEPGKYRLARAPYQAAMLDDMCDPTVVEFAWMIASQMGKTLCLLFGAGYYIHHDPSSLLVVYPKLDDAESWSKNKFEPFRLATPALAGLIRDNRERDSENTILEKSFPGGEITMAGANSPSTLRQKSKKIILLDEIDGYKPNAEGDPIEQADTRATNFYNAVKGKSSTPTNKRHSAIENKFEESDKQYWFCPCPKCGAYQTLKWAQVRWSFETPDGRFESRPEDAVYVCESCNAELTDQERIEMVFAGEWRATAPFNGIRGRHLNGIYRVIGKKRAFKSYLHEFVTQFLKAKHKGREALKVWTNTFLAETWEDQVERKDWTVIQKRAEQYQTRIPKPVLCIVGATDVQADRLESHLIGFGVDEESWGIEKKMFVGNPHLPQVWADMYKWAITPFEHPNGRRIQCAIMMVDSGGQSGRAGFAKPVYQFVGPKQNRGYGFGFWASKGLEAQGGHLRTESRLKNGIVLQKIGTHEAKSMVYSRLDIQEPGPRYMHFPIGYGFDDEYFMQLVAEEVEVVKVRGFVKNKWVKVRSRNEALDLWAMTVAGLDKLNPNWQKLLKLYGTPLEKVEETVIEEPEKAFTPPPRNQPKPQPQRPRKRLPFRRRRI